jgi:hypothetical protein
LGAGRRLAVVLGPLEVAQFRLVEGGPLLLLSQPSRGFDLIGA